MTQSDFITTQEHFADTHADALSTNKAASKLRVAFFGTNGQFSHRVLQQICVEFVDLCAVFCDASEPFHPHLSFDIHRLDSPAPIDSDRFGTKEFEIQLRTSPPGSSSNIIEFGWAADVPVYSVGQIRSKVVADTLDLVNIDVACVACFNKRIPPSLLKIPRLGFLNLHPSMLPDYRGPEPIQWILHDGGQGGVTIHWMDEDFDTGDIAYQSKVDFAPGMPYAAAEKLCANQGALAYVRVLQQLAQGEIPRTPQGHGGFYRERMGYRP